MTAKSAWRRFASNRGNAQVAYIHVVGARGQVKIGLVTERDVSASRLKAFTSPVDKLAGTLRS
jgi:hypothetical protein